MLPNSRFWRALVLVLSSLLIQLLAEGASAQDRPKVEITSQIPHSENAASVAFSPDGARLLSGSADYTLKLWDAATGQLTRLSQLEGLKG